MWTPSHVVVVVTRADNLLIKGKNGTNNAFVVIELGKEIYRTSVKEKSGKSVVWNEECELKIPKTGNAASIALTVLHRNSLGIDQFLGTVEIPLKSLDAHRRTLRWFKLEGKPGKDKGKEKVRGLLEVDIGFLSKKGQTQSMTSLQSKGKYSVEKLEKLTGSLFGLSAKGKNSKFKTLTATLQRSLQLKKNNKLSVFEDLEESGRSSGKNSANPSSSGSFSNLDPGVISDEEDGVSHKSTESLYTPLGNPSASALSIASNRSAKVDGFFSPKKNPEISISYCDDGKPHYASSVDLRNGDPGSPGKRKKSSKMGDKVQDELPEMRLSASCVDFNHLTSPKPARKYSSSLQLDAVAHREQSTNKLSKLARKLRNFPSVDKKEIKRTVIGCETGYKHDENIATSQKSEYKNKNKDELIRMVVELQKTVNYVSVRVKDLEEYLDEILLKVMENMPKILEKS